MACTVSIAGVQAALADFLDQRVLPGTSSQTLKWVLAGASTLALSQFDTLFVNFAPVLQGLGIFSEDNLIRIDKVETFLEGSFSKMEKVEVPVLGIPISFDRTDGIALVELLKRYGGAS